MPEGFTDVSSALTFEVSLLLTFGQAMIVYGPKNVPYDIDIGPVFLNDWYHTDYFTIVEQVMGTDVRIIRCNPRVCLGSHNL